MPRRSMPPRSRWSACAGRCSTTRSPGQAVYDPFLGSGTSLIAAETTGRVCLGIEIDPLYVNVAIRRWQAFTGKEARLSGNDRPFAEIEAERSAPKRVRRGQRQTSDIVRRRAFHIRPEAAALRLGQCKRLSPCAVANPSPRASR